MPDHDAFEIKRKLFIKSTKPKFSMQYGILLLAVAVIYFGGHVLYYLYTH
jgi:hypothetical protein